MKHASIRIAGLIGIVALLAAAPAESRLAHAVAGKIAATTAAGAWPHCRPSSEGSIVFGPDGHIAHMTPPNVSICD
ncbi:MAG TPA: hypothetical protein VIJ12_06290 [Candidatus Baltobacteraceae bacterium]